MSADVNRRAATFCLQTQAALSQQSMHGGMLSILQGAADLVYLLDDYHRRLPDEIETITPEQRHWFTHIMVDAMRLWQRLLNPDQQ